MMIFIWNKELSPRVCWQIQLMADFAMVVNNSQSGRYRRILRDSLQRYHLVGQLIYGGIYRHTFGKRTTVWTPQRTTSWYQRWNLGQDWTSVFPDRDKRGRPAGDNRRFSMQSCGSFAQEHPGVTFLQTMDT